MAINAIPEEVLQAEQERLLRKALVRLPPIVNAEAATTAHDEQRVQFRGRWYRVPAIRYRALIELTVVNQRIRDLTLAMETILPTPEQLEALRDLIQAAIDIMGTLIVWRWWQVRNPFNDAEQDEFKALMDFFFGARTRCLVRARHSTQASPYFQRTWETTWQSSPSITPPGSSTANPAAGGTTNSDRPLSLVRD